MTTKQRRFIEEYMADKNAAQAARRAGYRGRHPERQLMEAPAVRAGIEKAKREEAQEVRERVVHELAEVAFEESSGSSKLRALELLGKHLGLFNGKAETGEGGPVVISGEDALED